MGTSEKVGEKNEKFRWDMLNSWIAFWSFYHFLHLKPICASIWNVFEWRPKIDWYWEALEYPHLFTPIESFHLLVKILTSSFYPSDAYPSSLLGHYILSGVYTMYQVPSQWFSCWSGVWNDAFAHVYTKSNNIISPLSSTNIFFSSS